MNGVVLVVRQNVDVFFHLFHGEEVSSNIQHRTAILKFGSIHNFTGGNQPKWMVCKRIIAFLGNKLSQRLDAPKRTCGSFGIDKN